MEDFDEAEEQNEEDLLELGDSFGNINLKVIYSAIKLLGSCYKYTKRVHRKR
jgi:hypothetical protein